MANAFALDVADKLATLTFDVPSSKVNTLSSPVLRELEGIVAELESRSDLRGLLFRSGKPGQFIAGADLNELAGLAHVTKEQAEAGVHRGHKLFDRIGNLPFPTVALIDGPCMGGGTELVLAMDERLCSTNPKTQITLPETKIGIIPGWGGTQRLPRVVGIHAAVEMICSAAPADPQKAAACGLVFDAVPADRLIDEGKRVIDLMREDGSWQTRRQRMQQPVGLSEDERNFLFAVAEGYVRSQTKGHYPAPLVALQVLKESVNLPLEDGLKRELQGSLQVMGSPISANLIAMFFMSNQLERDPGVSAPDITPKPIHRVGVLGAGLMGSGIAAAHARRGIGTAMVDVDDQRIAVGLGRARDVVASRIKIGRATNDDLVDMLTRLTTSTNVNLFSGCDVVIEAIVEDEAAKKKAYEQIKPYVDYQAIIASNTSTISITRLATAVSHPERFCGMHFFNPVDRMQLVEVIRGEQTSDETTATIVALAKRIQKTPIVVRDCPGFLVNRILFPYMNEALQLLVEGASLDAIDKAATKFGMPMGPILLHDVVGLDTALYAGQVIHHAYPDRSLASPLLDELVRAGRLGQKSGAGFRSFDKKSAKGRPDPKFDEILAKHKTEDREVSADEITDRLFLPMLLEATRTLEERIVREPAHVDMGLILGLGFPAFRGGILRWLDAEGPDKILAKLERYHRLGKRFEPTETVTRLAKTGERIYAKPKTIVPFAQ